MGTVNAASVSFTDVNAAITAALDGDTVVIPAGTASWTSGIGISNKNLTVVGQTTTDPVAKTATMILL